MLWYGMSKAEVLEQVYPDEVQFLLDKARRHRALRLAEEVQVRHTQDPAGLFANLMGQASREPPQKADFAEGLAKLAEARANLAEHTVGDQDLARKIRLHARAWQLVRGNRGRTDS